MQGEPRKILLVEDEAAHAELVRRAFEAGAGNFILSIASDLQEARAKLAEAAPDLVITDLILPDGRGTELLPKAGEDRSFPVVVMTAQRDEKIAVAAMKSGALDYVVKSEATFADMPHIAERALREWRHICERRRTEKELLFKNALLEAQSETSIDGILAIDNNAEVILCNERFRNIWQVPEGLLDAKDDNDLLLHFREQVVGPREFMAQVKHLYALKDGRILDRFSAPLLASDGKYYGRIWYFRDITERKQMMRKRIEADQKQLDMKDQFLSHVSHELRTPLAVIYQFVTIMLDGLSGEINSEQRKNLEFTLAHVLDLRKMIDDLLEVTRSKTGTLSITPSKTFIPDVIADTVNMLHQKAVSKKITLSSEAPTDLPPVLADPDRVRQILSNLIGNSLKFTPEDGTVTVKAKMSNDAQNVICISVADTGCGISPKARERIFEHMYQAKTPILRTSRGLGLGLFISKQLVEQQGGRIWVESEPGQGSTFLFTLPVFTNKRTGTHKTNAKKRRNREKTG